MQHPQMHKKNENLQTLFLMNLHNVHGKMMKMVWDSMYWEQELNKTT